MKKSVIIFAILACFLDKHLSTVGGEIESLNLDNVNNVLLEYEGKQISDDIGVITAVVNDYADRLFPMIQKFAVAHKLDPVCLDDISQNFLGSSLSLKNGTLNGISTIHRYNDVVVSYQHDVRKLVIEFPVIFTDLNFMYHYHVILLIMGPEGEMVGDINNFKINVKLSFDFNTYTAKIEKLTTMDSGHISLTFHGQGLVDLIVNLLSEFVTTILHPLLTAIIEGKVKDAAGSVVNGVNTFIHDLIHPNSTHNLTHPYYH